MPRPREPIRSEKPANFGAPNPRCGHLVLLWGELRVATTEYMANVQRQHQVQGEEREQVVSMARKP